MTYNFWKFVFLVCSDRLSDPVDRYRIWGYMFTNTCYVSFGKITEPRT